MAALMGNLASAANSISTLFSYDLWRRFRPDTPEHRLVIIGRTATFCRSSWGLPWCRSWTVREHFRRHQRRDRPHRPADHLRLHARRVLGKGLGPQREADDVDRLGLGALLFALKTLHTWQPDDVRLGSAVLLRDAVHDDGVLPVLRCAWRCRWP